MGPPALRYTRLHILPASAPRAVELPEVPVRRFRTALVRVLLAALMAAAALPAPAAGWTSSPSTWDAHDWVVHQAVRVAEENGFRWVDLRVALPASHDASLAPGASGECVPTDPSHEDAAGRIASLFDEAVVAYRGSQFETASAIAGRMGHLVADLGDPFFAAGADSSMPSVAAYNRILQLEVREVWRRSGWIDTSLPGYVTNAGAAASGLSSAAASREPLAAASADRFLAGLGPTHNEYRPMAHDLNRSVRTLASLIAAIEVAAQREVVDVERWGGENRYETAAELSRRAFPDGADAVVVASGSAWPDALAAAPLAGLLGAPVLLTEATDLPTATRAEITRLGARAVYVVGGDAVVSPRVIRVLESFSAVTRVRRVAGADRYATSSAVAALVRAADPAAARSAFVCTGAGFADALAASQIAAEHRSPIVLVASGGTPDYAVGAVRAAGATSVTIAGGAGVVSAAVEARLSDALGTGNVTRAAGADRYGTAAALFRLAEQRHGAPYATVLLSRGDHFADSLAAGPAAAHAGGSLLISGPARLGGAGSAALRASAAAVTRGVLVGGTGALSQYVAFDVQRACDPAPVIAPPRPAWEGTPTAHYSATPDVLSSDVGLYYRERGSTADVLAQWPHDANGVVMVDYGDGPPVYNPTTVANYGIGLYERYLQTSDVTYLRRFLVQATWLRDSAMDTNGRFVYLFDLPARGLSAPWWSAMAQGQGISALVRAYRATGDESYLRAAEKAFRPCTVPVPAGVTSGSGGELWLEEYAATARPTQVLNGSVFAMWGVWDLWRVTHRGDVRAVFDRATATLGTHLDDYEQDGHVLYERVPGVFASGPYVDLQAAQLATLTDLTGDRAFAERADRWALTAPGR